MQRTLKQPAERGAGVVAWLLIFMALATFAPCVLLPEWRAYEALLVEEQVERHRLESLKRVVDRERRLLDALQSDPAVLARLAQRDLSFKQRSSRPVRVSVPGLSGPTEQLFTPEPAGGATGGLPAGDASKALAASSRWHLPSYLPDYDYDAVFCDEGTRLVIMTMSVALMVVALSLPAPRSSAACGRGATGPDAHRDQPVF